MANTFLKASGIEVGDSLVEDDVIDLASQLLDRAGTKLVLPKDVIVADRLEVGAQTCTLEVEQGVGPGYSIVDIGPDTTKMFGDYIDDARIIIWNGPMGAFEVPEFAGGTNAIARRVAHSNATSVVGGGDSAAAVYQSGYANLISHVSTGGGATLEILRGKTLPAVAVLDQM